mgnify:CR=1 FL=1
MPIRSGNLQLRGQTRGGKDWVTVPSLLPSLRLSFRSCQSSRTRRSRRSRSQRRTVRGSRGCLRQTDSKQQQRGAAETAKRVSPASSTRQLRHFDAARWRRMTVRAALFRVETIPPRRLMSTRAIRPARNNTVSSLASVQLLLRQLQRSRSRTMFTRLLSPGRGPNPQIEVSGISGTVQTFDLCIGRRVRWRVPGRHGETLQSNWATMT